MGRGPQELIYKKLIASYLRFNVSGLKVDTRAVGQVIGSMQKYGRHAPETNIKKSELSYSIQQSQKELEFIKKETNMYPTLISNYLYQTKHKGEKKGRYQVPADYYLEIEKDTEKVDI